MILIVGCGKEEKGATKVEEPLKIAQLRPLMNSIAIIAEGDILHYQREYFWNDEDFSKLLESKEEFKTTEIDYFETNLQRYNRYAVNSKIEFNELKKLTVLLCDITGVKEGYWFDFDWFLRPYGLDFVDSHFERKEKELSWEGEVEGIETTISIKFPYSISNCHEHVWSVE